MSGAVGRKPQPAPAAFAREVSSAIRRELGDRKMSNRELGRQAGLSEKYLRDRLNDVASFSLTDVAAICRVWGADPGEFLADPRKPLLRPPAGNVTPLRPNDGGFIDDALKDQGLDTAAGSDETQADDDGA